MKLAIVTSMTISMASSPLLKVIDFTHIRGGRLLFKNLSFEFRAGEALILMGPNGSGKTTLLRRLAGIPDGLSGITKAPNLTQSYVGHANALKAGMTVRQNLCYQTDVTPERLARFLKEMKLDAFADRQIGTLSAGQRRQVALMRLSLSEAALWLVDEPTTHLDEAATTRFWGSLEKHLKVGGAAVLTSHTPVPLPHAKIIQLHG